MKQSFPFYEKVDIDLREDGNFLILLDRMPLHSCKGNLLVLPFASLAEKLALEWRHQKQTPDRLSMPFFRLVEIAVDSVSGNIPCVVEDILQFMSCDMLFYYADSPAGLVERQKRLWSPVLEGIFSFFGVRFLLTHGVSYVEQPLECFAPLARFLKCNPHPLYLAALYLATTLSGSALLAVSCALGHFSADELWKAAFVDEDWQIGYWGEDLERSERRKKMEHDFMACAFVLDCFRLNNTFQTPRDGSLFHNA